MREALAPEHEPIAARLAADAIYWIESCLFIIDKNSEKVPFLTNAVQKLFFAARTLRDIVLKARKMGISTFILAIMLHACVFRKNTRAVVISHEEEATLRLLERLRYMIKHSLWPINVGKDKEGMMTFPDTDSWIYIGTAGSRSFGRGDDITHALLSEPAFYKSLDIITSVGQALVNNAWMVLESTANGAGTPYHELWLAAEKGISEFLRHFFPWWRDPAYAKPEADARMELAAKGLTPEEKKLQGAFGLSLGQIAWRRWKIRDMHGDVKKFAQEYPATAEEAFLASGRMVFDWEAILAQEKANEGLEPKWCGVLVDAGTEYTIEPVPEGPLTIWVTARAGAEYLLSFDSGKGVEDGDYSVASVWDARTWQQVAQYRALASEMDFGDVCYGLGALYNWAPIAGENNYPGNAVYQRLIDRKYPNLWRDPHATTRAAGGAPQEPGFKTTAKSKGLMIADLRQGLAERDVRLLSPQTLRELKTFCVLDNGAMGAREGCHDDTVMEAAVAVHVLKRWTMDPDERRLAQQNHLSTRIGRNKPAYGIAGRSGTAGARQIV